MRRGYVSRIQSRKFFKKSSYGSNWKEISKQCRERDSWCCVKCGYSPNFNERHKLHADHIIPITKGGNNSLANLQTLCYNCHSKKHKRPL